jgi:DNA polymerase III subunit delta'
MTTQEQTTHNWHIYGHDWAVDFLRNGMLNNRTRHAYLITGTRSVGKMTLAQNFAMALNCQHEDITQRPCFQCKACKSLLSGNNPDLIYSQIEESGRLKIDEIRRITRLLALRPYSSRYRVAIFDDFDMASPQSQDALLKTLEEPASYAVLILLAQSTDRILPTITSRSQTVPLRPVSLDIIKQRLVVHGAEEDRADLIARLSSGRVGWALAALADDDVLAFRADMLDMLRDIIASNRVERFKISDQLSRKMGRDKPLLRYVLEIWQTYWRDVLLESYDSPVKPCNSDRKEEIRTLVTQLDSAKAYSAMDATRRTLKALSTNANVRLALDVLFLDYPGLDKQ